MRKKLMIVAAAAAAVALVAAFAYVRANPRGESYMSPTVNETDLASLAESTVFFAHQSVGANVLDGIPSVYADHGVSAPTITETTGAAADGPGLLHVQIGTNGDPLGKIEAFDSMIRSGLGDTIDVAVLKLCYVDIHEGADVEAIFAAYRDTLAALQRDYPDVAFIASTVPVTVKRGPLASLKALLGKADRYGPEHNTVRQELNSLLRDEYSASGRLFDVAALESTTAGGDRVTGRHDGRVYYSLNEAYASDRGHLNSVGAAAVATGFLAVVAGALED